MGRSFIRLDLQSFRGFEMRKFVKPALSEIVKVALFFAAGAVLVFGMLNFR